jgi:hypothetical protein
LSQPGNIEVQYAAEILEGIGLQVCCADCSKKKLRIGHLMSWDHVHVDSKEDNAEKIVGNKS